MAASNGYPTSTYGLREGATRPKAKHLGPADWIVRPHGTLHVLADNLWWTWGSSPGASRRRSMVLAKRRDGDVVVYDALALDEDGMRALEAIGKPRYLVVPDATRRMEAHAFIERYPNIQVFAPRGARAAIAKVARVDGILEDFPADDDVLLRTLHGVGDTSGALLVSSSDGLTVALGDLVTQLDRRREPLALLRTTLLGPAPALGAPRLAQVLFVRDRRALRRDLVRLSEHLDLVRLVDGSRVLARAEAVTALAQAAAAV